MAQITWRNINAPDLTGVADIMKSGGDQVLGGIGSLRKMAADANQRKADAWDTQARNNTNDLLARIQAENTIEGAQGLRDQITGDYLQQNYGRQVDAAKVLAAASGQEQLVRDKLTADYNWKETERNRQEAPVIAQFEDLLGANKFEDARNLLDAGGILNTGSYRDRLEAAQRGEKDYQRDQDTLHRNNFFNEEVRNLLSQVQGGDVPVADAQEYLYSTLMNNGATPEETIKFSEVFRTGIDIPRTPTREEESALASAETILLDKYAQDAQNYEASVQAAAQNLPFDPALSNLSRTEAKLKFEKTLNNPNFNGNWFSYDDDADEFKEEYQTIFEKGLDVILEDDKGDIRTKHYAPEDIDTRYLEAAFEEAKVYSDMTGSFGIDSSKFRKILSRMLANDQNGAALTNYKRALDEQKAFNKTRAKNLDRDIRNARTKILKGVGKSTDRAETISQLLEDL